jgi:hypothetical protein
MRVSNVPARLEGGHPERSGFYCAIEWFERIWGMSVRCNSTHLQRGAGMNYSYSYSSGNTDGGGAAAAIFGGCSAIFWLVIGVILIVAMWKLFTKAGKPGWAAIIPIYNVIVLLEIVGRPLWWVILLFIPFVNIVVEIILMVDLARAYGKSTGFALGLIFLSPIFLPILAFGSARYVGPAAAVAAGTYYPPQQPAGGGYYPPQPPYAPPAPPAPPAYQPPPAPPAYQPPPAPPAPPVPPAPPYEPPAPPAPPAPPVPPA